MDAFSFCIDAPDIRRFKQDIIQCHADNYAALWFCERDIDIKMREESIEKERDKYNETEYNAIERCIVEKQVRRIYDASHHRNRSSIIIYAHKYWIPRHNIYLHTHIYITYICSCNNGHKCKQVLINYYNNNTTILTVLYEK